jgi:hypothetical protein
MVLGLTCGLKFGLLSGAYPASHLMGTGASSIGLNGRSLKLHHSSPCTDKIMNERRCIFTPPIRLHGVDREDVVFTLSLQYNFRTRLL